MRKLLVVIGVLVLLAVIAAVVVTLNLDKVVKVGVEQGGRAALGVRTELDGASVSLLGGKVGLNGLALSSPQGFSEPVMFALGHGSAAADVWSLLRREIVVHQVLVDGAEITLELGKGGTNWGALLRHLKDEPKPAREEEKRGKTVRIGRIVFRNGSIKIAGLPMVSGTLTLPDFEINDLRTDEGAGVTVRKLLPQVIVPLYAAILKGVKGKIPASQFKLAIQELELTAQELSGLFRGGKLPDPEELNRSIERIKSLLDSLPGKDSNP